VLDLPGLALTGAAFLAAGTLKGIVGLGMPIVVIGITAPVFGLTTAIQLVILPGAVTNIRQALRGGMLGAILRRQKWLLATTAVGIWLGTLVLAGGEGVWLSRLLGAALVAYALYALFLPQLPPPGRAEPVLSPAVGLTSGLMSGMVGVWAVPGVIWMALLRLPRDELVQTLGIVFVTISLALGGSFAQRALLEPELVALSALALPAMLGGLVIGERLRSRIPEQAFRRVFLVALLVLGGTIAATA
jgi:uncharacterized membrane protein YfcA